MELDRLYEVINLSSVVQIVHNDKLVRVESVKESDNGDIAQVVYAESGRHANVPVEANKIICSNPPGLTFNNKSGSRPRFIYAVLVLRAAQGFA
jgi:hypothetical protein